MDHNVIGREREQAAIAEFLDRCAGGPRALFLEGSPGIGKSTLWESGLAAAAEGSFTVLSSRPAQSEAQLSYAVLSDLLDEVFDDISSELPVPQRTALEVALLRSEAGAMDARAISVGVLRSLRLLAGEGPLLVAVDDAQWMDTGSGHVLEFALRRLDNEPVGVFISSRSGERRPLELERDLGPDQSTRVCLEPMSLGALSYASGRSPPLDVAGGGDAGRLCSGADDDRRHAHRP